MKRQGNLIHQIADPDNLRLAFYKAQKGKSGKAEVRKFADNLDKNLITLRGQILMKLLEARFKDRTLLHIFQKIIESYETDNSKGIPIGNLTSQYFANHYLAVSDHFIKEKLKIKNYNK